jgi:twinkle protein
MSILDLDDDAFVEAWKTMRGGDRVALGAVDRDSCYRRFAELCPPRIEYREALPGAYVGPIVEEPIEYRSSLDDLWDSGLPPGYRTGWPSLDVLYTVVPGQLTVVTGWPSSGKSQFVDALAVNLARQGWRFAVFSPENHPTQIHLAKLLQLVSGKPFGAGQTERMSLDEMHEHLDHIRDWFGFVRGRNHETLSVMAILEAAGKHLDPMRDVQRGLIVDPYNEIGHERPAGMSETDWVSALLTGIRNWARDTSTHVWLVAHPQKLRRLDSGELPVPTPDTISGSQHFWNKSDCAITIWRDLSPLARDSQEVSIYVQKIRFAHVGHTGMVELQYDRPTGRYFERATQDGHPHEAGENRAADPRAALHSGVDQARDRAPARRIFRAQQEGVGIA